MSETFFSAVISPVIHGRFRSSNWAREYKFSKNYARWYIALLDKYSTKSASFAEIDTAVTNHYRTLPNAYGAYGYFRALLKSGYYKHTHIFTKVS